MSIFSERLKWLREKNGLTQKEIGESLGMTGPSYSKYEYGLREPNLSVLLKIVQTVGERSDFLIGAIDLDKKAETLLSRFEDKRFFLTSAIRRQREISVRLKDRLDDEAMNIYMAMKETVQKAIDEYLLAREEYEKYSMEIPLINPESIQRNEFDNLISDSVNIEELLNAIIK